MSLEVLPGEKTGFSNPKCYLAADCNCDKKISKEHPILESILKLLTEEDGKLIIEGHSKQQDGKRLYPASYTSYILCERHNVALGKTLDAELKNFFEAIVAVSTAKDHNTIPDLIEFDGMDIQRGLLKTLYGVIQAKFLDEKCTFDKGTALKILYETLWENDSGLWIYTTPHNNKDFAHNIAPIINIFDKKIHGGMFRFLHLTLFLTLSKPSYFTLVEAMSRNGMMANELIHKPTELKFIINQHEKVIRLKWKNESENRFFKWELQ